MRFKVLKKSAVSRARLGLLTLGNTEVETPLFMPVGTRATVKTLSSEDLKEIGFSLILANTYHLVLRPGMDVLRQAGGLHRFMNWDRAILTDSGGYQVFSLSKLKKISDDGVLFQSPIDGKENFFTPRNVMESQIALGSDIVMCLDECVEHTASLSRTRMAMERTLLWAGQCLDVFQTGKQPGQNLFGIIQGGFFPELRKESLERTAAMPFDGLAIGGLSVGEAYDRTFEVLDTFIGSMPEEKPRYFMGLGSLKEMEQAVEMGADMFDSVWPTRNARNGRLLTGEGKIQVRNAKFRTSREPPDGECGCFVCQNYTLSYLHHLFNVEEILGYRLATYHNLFFLNERLKKIRERIRNG